MADKNSKVNENVPGEYYIDTECTACAVCEGIAPDIFKTTEAGSHAYVAKQPSNEDEKNLYKNAMESCPAEAIGDDEE